MYRDHRDVESTRSTLAVDSNITSPRERSLHTTRIVDDDHETIYHEQCRWEEIKGGMQILGFQ
jgi:hypothetical protein